MKRTFLVLALTLGVYHVTTTAVEKTFEPKVLQLRAVNKLSKTDHLRQDLSKILAKTNGLENFKMAKVDLY